VKPSEPEPYHPDAVADDEPRYHRRQRPVEIRRRRIAGRAWRTYLRVSLGVVVVAVLAVVLYQGWRYLMRAPRFALATPEQVVLRGNRYVSRAAVLERFTADAERSVFRVPLAERRRALEEIPWVERATVRRVLPNRLEVEIVERTPRAFLRLGAELALIDAEGVILERPVQGEFRFPVVTGLSEATPREERERRMRRYAQFLAEIDLARPGANEFVSEVDVADRSDLRATLAGLPGLGDPGADGQGAVLVHFGDGHFTEKFRVFAENIAQWRASAGRVDSVDLRFERQVVVNPEARSEGAAAQGPAAKARQP
jgi:cell division protein FtsQ